MKIAILTLPFDNNYGGYLQAYALQTYLEQKEHQVTIINRQWPDSNISTRFKRALKNMLKSIIQFEKYPICDFFNYKGFNMHKFVDANMHLSPPIKSSDDLAKFFLEHCYDLVIVGSDQLWRPEYVPNVEDYFLGFLPDGIKKIAYAASFGTSSTMYTEEQVNNCGKALQSFDIVTLREKSGIRLLQKFRWVTKSSPIIVLDPTMLIPYSQYCALLQKYSPSNDYTGKILSYVLDYDNQTDNILKSLSSVLNKPIADVIDVKKWKKDNYIFPPIEEWLCAFKDADFVFTDSFHGTVFSILFHKDFCVKINFNRGADRFETLLDHFDLRDRMISDEHSIHNLVSKTIDWNEVDMRLSQHRIITSNIFQNL